MPGQLSLLSRGPLFAGDIHRKYLADMRARNVPQEAERTAALKEWVDALAATGKVDTKAKETALEQLFNQTVLGEVLGYSLYPGAAGSAWPKAPTGATGISGEPDVMLGSFKHGEEPEFLAVLELKAPGIDLDAPQTGRTPPVSPVGQAFAYGKRALGVRWVLVSDMRVIRLYSVDSQHESVSFDLRDCFQGDAPVTAKFRELYWFLSRECLIEGGEQAPLARLLAVSVSEQLAIRDSFYEAYYRIRGDLLEAIDEAVKVLPTQPSRDEVLEATQRLLDRMLFLYYCEDTPNRLIPPDTVKNTTEFARRLPGPSTGKVFEALKALFREVDEGSPPTAEVKLSGYNGELFKEHPIIDHIELPDTLHDKQYPVEVGGQARHIKGVWGLHKFDFWKELNEHLLGHIFEQSLSDMQALAAGHSLNEERLAERKRHGVYYTSQVLSDYLAENALRAVLNESVPVTSTANKGELREVLQAREKQLSELRVIDMACGSGAFLVSSYQALLEEFWSIREGLDTLTGGTPDLLTHTAGLTQARLLRESLYGADLLPQAVEIAKLALWLRSAKKEEKVANLSGNLVAQNSLKVDALLGAMSADLGTFDLVVGNPPWGGEIDDDTYAACCQKLGLDGDPEWDSWELFIALGLALLREGGRLAFVLPDTIFSPEKERTRRMLLGAGAIEYFHNLGTDWFENVRMGTTVIQVRRGTVPMGHTFRALLLSGDRRRNAIAGKLPLSQLATAFGRDIPQDRCIGSDTAEIEVFRGVADDALMDRMAASSRPLAELCDRWRGEEVNKAGALWVCPNCLTATLPARKRKRQPGETDGRRYREKKCPGCDVELNEDIVSVQAMVEPKQQTPTEADTALYIDGDDINRRYVKVEPDKELRLDFQGFKFKDADLYDEPKLVIRQAGVGLLATLDETGARFPQSVYGYRLKPAALAEGYTHEFLLGVLISRTMAYFVFKRFSEVDPARAHAKVTHERLSAFPIPAIDFSDPEQRKLHDNIAQTVRGILEGEVAPGGTEDRSIDVMLSRLWGLSPEDGMHVLMELAQLPEGQVIRDLFPKGIPKQILQTTETAVPDEVSVAMPV